MTAPVSFVLAVIGMIVSACTRYHGIPALWLFDAGLVLGLAAVVLCVIRGILADRPARESRPVRVHVITSLR